MEEQRIVKGIWIPIEIWKDENLTWNEKILFLEIDSFTSQDKDCFFSNDYIAELLGISETNANKTLSSLIKKGYVIKTKIDGRKRYIKSALSISTRKGCQHHQPLTLFDNNIYINKPTNKTINKEEKYKKEEIDAFVEKIYKMYPTKCPMRNISLGKTKKDKERIEKLLKFYSMEEIEKVVKHEIDEKYGKAYMSNFSTFLNNFPDPQSLFDDISNNVESSNTNDDGKEVVINGQLYR